MITHILTANHLIEGHVVFLDEAGIWVPGVNLAARASTPADKALLDQLAATARAANLVIEPYLVEIEPDNSATTPVENRERLRALGPTVRPDLGYQSGTWKSEPTSNSGDEIVRL